MVARWEGFGRMSGKGEGIKRYSCPYKKKAQDVGTAWGIDNNMEITSAGPGGAH